MIYLFLLSLTASGEWIGNITLHPSNKTHHNLKIKNYGIGATQLELNADLEICKSSSCVHKVSILPYNTSTLYELSKCNSTVAIIITDDNFKSNLSATVFKMSTTDAGDLLEDDSTSLTLCYNYDCSDYGPLLILYTILFVMWVFGTTLWVYNNHQANHSHAELFHKFCTVLLVFKLLNVVANLAEYLHCPPARMTLEVLELFQKQTRSLYETSFFAYLLLLSKGWFLIMNTMGRKEFNYLVILVIFIYIFDSAVNIIGLRLKSVSFFMYCVVVFHVLVFGINTLKLLHTQMEVIRETGMDLLLPVTVKKKNIFVVFLAIMMGYFVGEYLMHFYLFSAVERLDKPSNEKLVLESGVHEFVEAATIFGIFYLYRARDMGRFFTVDFESRPSFMRILPFYESKRECEDGLFMTVILPRKKIMLGKLK